MTHRPENRFHQTAGLLALLGTMLVGCAVDAEVDIDADGDGWTSRVDCDDEDPLIHPDADEICDWLDQDCDGRIDEGLDGDGDGLTTCGGDCDDDDPTIPAATDPCDLVDQDCDGSLICDGGTIDADNDGYSADGSDCDDEDPLIHPLADEICDALDQDCDGSLICDGGTVDADNDGYSADGLDCDDTDPTIHPGAHERCDGVDDDCDGDVDEGFWPDVDGDEYRGCTEDCDDLDPTIHPGRPEVCDGVDNDWDGLLPEEEMDVDADGFVACVDCDDLNPAVHPLAVEVCNGIDDDCNPVTSEEVDFDGDGTTACEGDCGPADPAVGPGMEEICDGFDTDCDGSTDAGDVDMDGDSVPPCAGDCDDADPLANTGLVEACDGRDSDCDGVIPAAEEDTDGDGTPDCLPLVWLEAMAWDDVIDASDEIGCPSDPLWADSWSTCHAALGSTLGASERDYDEWSFYEHRRMETTRSSAGYDVFGPSGQRWAHDGRLHERIDHYWPTGSPDAHRRENTAAIALRRWNPRQADVDHGGVAWRISMRDYALEFGPPGQSDHAQSNGFAAGQLGDLGVFRQRWISNYVAGQCQTTQITIEVLDSETGETLSTTTRVKGGDHPDCAWEVIWPDGTTEPWTGNPLPAP